VRPTTPTSTPSISSKKLADDDPGNASRQRELGVSLDKIGDVRLATGRLSEAGDAYQHSLDIAQRLADDDPDNADYQRELASASTRSAMCGSPRGG